jgi:hypothetical protein
MRSFLTGLLFLNFVLGCVCFQPSLLGLQTRQQIAASFKPKLHLKPVCLDEQCSIEQEPIRNPLQEGSLRRFPGCIRSSKYLVSLASNLVVFLLSYTFPMIAFAATGARFGGSTFQSSRSRSSSSSSFGSSTALYSRRSSLPSFSFAQRFSSNLPKAPSQPVKSEAVVAKVGILTRLTDLIIPAYLIEIYRSKYSLHGIFLRFVVHSFACYIFFTVFSNAGLIYYKMSGKLGISFKGFTRPNDVNPQEETIRIEKIAITMDEKWESLESTKESRKAVVVAVDEEGSTVEQEKSIVAILKDLRAKAEKDFRRISVEEHKKDPCMKVLTDPEHKQFEDIPSKMHYNKSRPKLANALHETILELMRKEHRWSAYGYERSDHGNPTYLQNQRSADTCYMRWQVSEIIKTRGDIGIVCYSGKSEDWLIVKETTDRQLSDKQQQRQGDGSDNDYAAQSPGHSAAIASTENDVNSSISSTCSEVSKPSSIATKIVVVLLVASVCQMNMLPSATDAKLGTKEFLKERLTEIAARSRLAKGENIIGIEVLWGPQRLQ